jgi:hypothetical protein
MTNCQTRGDSPCQSSEWVPQKPPTFDDIPLPGGVVEFDDFDARNYGSDYRIIRGAERGITDNSNVAVSTNACQYTDGHLDEFLVSLMCEDLNSDQARELAAALLEAAAELDRWAA